MFGVAETDDRIEEKKRSQDREKKCCRRNVELQDSTTRRKATRLPLVITYDDDANVSGEKTVKAMMAIRLDRLRRRYGGEGWKERCGVLLA